MHIPDGYLSPQTCAVMTVAMAPLWAVAVKKVNNTVRTKYLPLMALGAAFSFTLMMFNIPIPNGTTTHAVGGGILAIILGPWAAMISITVALAIQALLFGDGGILAFGANCFNIAFIFPFTSYYVFRFIAGNAAVSSARYRIGSLLAGYIGINLAALCAAIQLGLQPLLFHTADGAPLYCPYPIGITIPAMALIHLLVAGPIEAVITALLVGYLFNANRQVLPENSVFSKHDQPGLGKLWWGLGAMILLCPLGLLAPGTAWSEWSREEVHDMLGFVPTGLANLSDRWPALLPDYAFPGFSQVFWQNSLGYIGTAIIGVAAICAITYLFGRVQKTTDKN